LIEFLSIGDYGKDSNIKADFLGITRELNGVPNGEIMPLSEKWVITISTQYGCSMGCKFCDVPKVGKGLNATLNDLTNQLIEGLKIHPEVGATKRLNLHYARMGEPTFNFDVIEHAKQLHKIVKPHIGNSMIHPVISTMLPKANKRLMEFLNEWCDIKNYTYRGDAGLQFSINSTDDEQRNEMFSGNTLPLNDIAEIGRLLPDKKGRKYALNFALADNYIVDAEKLAMLFNPNKFMVKITPLHKTQSCDANGIITTDGYEAFTPYHKAETDLKNAGFDVIVFVPSYDEDLGLITCGNAILSGSIPKVKFTQVL
jgi:23S rRNA (adenine2503-C2)-methyltransferase